MLAPFTDGWTRRQRAAAGRVITAGIAEGQTNETIMRELRRNVGGARRGERR
jgi:hypothetical protein